MAQRQRGELFGPAVQESVREDHERDGAQLGQPCKNRFKVTLVAGMQDMELQPERAGRAL